MARSWCITSFAIIVGSYDVSPPLLSCNGLSFPFEVILSDWVFKDLRTLDVCLACAYLWWQWDIHVIYLMYVLVINLRVPWPWEPMHRGWHTFLSWLSDRNFGALFEVLCVGWIDESEIVWCISYNHTHEYLRWQWSIEVTLGFWLMCVLRCYSSTNSRVVCDTYRNSPMDWLERITLRWFRTLP